ncbi:MAG: metallophosphoesterase, partial [Deltaproteobacteria bacterium]|nr:metallophosphoesterase [Deltaproteobacteria bacterium]
MSRPCAAFASLLLAVLPIRADAQEIVVGPFLQSATPTEIWVVWETDTGDESRVEWGSGEALDQTSTGGFHEGHDGSRIHEVHLAGLDPETRYVYRVATGGAQSATWHFVTPPEASAERSFRLVAMSDMQRSSSNPGKYAEVVQDGVIDYVSVNHGPDMAEEIGLVLAVGDLVQDGWDYPQWAEDFFAPGAELMAQVPYYPVLGNHEDDTPYYFRYFHLPDNGTEGYLEHWWYADYSNLRLIGLDSNFTYWTEAQTSWLDDVLTEVCGDPDIDFVFAQLHHPAKSELWLPGESIFTGRIVEQLEQFTADCDKPSIHFFGHTHGYSRGQSQEHRHLMVNVAVAGGSIDYWGDSAQRDYPEFAVSTDDWGFVLVEVQAGQSPEFRLRRVSRGDNDVPLDNTVTDEVVVRLHNATPSSPAPIGPRGDEVLADCFALEASAFSDPDGDAHGASQWQIASDCSQFSLSVYDSWRQDRNLYFEVDTQAGDDLTDEHVFRLGEERTWCWRLRYRDDGLAWSDWSEPLTFTTTAFVRTENLLANPGAEDGDSGWVETEGPLESVHLGDCETPAAHGGTQSFSLGGGCAGEVSGVAKQEVDVSDHA